MRGLARGWSPSPSQSIAVRIVVGTLLLVNPLYIGAFGLGPGYTYEREPVTVTDGRITVGDRPIPRTSLDGIACTGLDQSFECAYQYARFAGGEYPVEFPDVVVGFAGPRYVYQYGRGDDPARYYRRRVVDTGNERRAIRLTPVAPETVLREVSMDASDAPLRVRWALLTGRIRTDRPLPAANRVVETPDGYVVLVRTRVAGGETLLGLGYLEWLLATFGVIAGGVSILRGYRRIDPS